MPKVFYINGKNTNIKAVNDMEFFKQLSGLSGTFTLNEHIKKTFNGNGYAGLTPNEAMSRWIKSDVQLT